MAEIDLTRAPTGVLAAQELIAAVAEHGDLAERHYLELKSTLDLSTKKDKEKIAKFILGASNRMPDVAATAFEGYCVMIVGIAQGSITGIPQVEMMEISKIIQQYVGAAGPRWDIVWVPVEGSKNHVLVVCVNPPRLGQGPFPCRSNGVSLTDGRIYIRADGETREANSEEVDLLIARGTAGSTVDVDFGVEVIGEVTSLEIDTSTTVDEYVARVRKRLIAALPDDESKVRGQTVTSSQALAGLVTEVSTIARLAAMADVFTEPEKRTEQDYRDSIDRWESRFRSAWDKALDQIAGSRLRPAIVKVTNRTSTFFHDVEVKLHLAGDIAALEYRDPEYIRDTSDLELPSPPRKWGPTQRSLGITNYPNAASFYSPSPGQYSPPSVSFTNGGSVTLNLDIGELRPRGSYESEDEEFVLVVADRDLASIRGTWELTARDHNNVYTGEIELDVMPTRDLTQDARQLLGLGEGNDSERVEA